MRRVFSLIMTVCIVVLCFPGEALTESEPLSGKPFAADKSIDSESAKETSPNAFTDDDPFDQFNQDKAFGGGGSFGEGNHQGDATSFDD